MARDDHDAATIQKYVPDLMKDKFHVALARFYYLPLLVSGVILFAIGGWSVRWVRRLFTRRTDAMLVLAVEGLRVSVLVVCSGLLVVFALSATVYANGIGIAAAAPATDILCGLIRHSSSDSASAPLPKSGVMLSSRRNWDHPYA